MNARRPYLRPMNGWWLRQPWYVEYMVHEATALFVGGYALLLLAGLACLASGAEAWEAWLVLLRSPPVLAFSLLSLAAFVYHAITWFVIMPRTLPPVRVAGTRLTARTITGAGLAVAVVTNFLAWLTLTRWLP